MIYKVEFMVFVNEYDSIVYDKYRFIVSNYVLFLVLLWLLRIGWLD